MAAINREKVVNMGYFIATLALFVFLFCLVWFFVRLIKRKPKKQPALGMLVCFALIVVGVILTPTPDKETDGAADIPDPNPKQDELIQTDDNDVLQGEDDSNNSKMQVKSEEDRDESAEEPLLYNIDWDKCSDDLKESVLNQEFFPYAKDVYVSVNEDRELITFSAVVEDSTSPEIALDYADTLIRQYNLMANMQDNTIKLGSKDSYGGLYDKYDILIGVSPQSNTDNQDEWYIFDAIISGTHRKIKLQKAYT